MDFLQNFLGRLKRVRKVGRGWKASCPLHDDPEASLSINMGWNGGIQFFCHAGCTPDWSAKQRLLAKLGLRPSDIYANGRKFKVTANNSERPTVSLEMMDEVYTELLRCLVLQEGHLDHLCNRGLTYDEVQANAYKSLEVSPFSLSDWLFQKYGHDLVHVPGVGACPMGHPYFKGRPGLVIPIRNSGGLIRAIQIRTGKPDCKYWFPEGSGCPIHVPLSTWPYGILGNGEVWVTEGPLKADVAVGFRPDLPIVAVASVSSWKAIMPALKQWGINRVVTAFDQDWVSKQTVLGQLEQFEQALEHAGHDVYRATWDERSKGLDDALAMTREIFTINRQTGEVECVGESEQAEGQSA